MEEKSTEAGRLHYTISVDGSALKFVCDLQRQICDYENEISMLLHAVINPDFKYIPIPENTDIKLIQGEVIKMRKEIISLKEQLTNTKSN